MSHHLSPSSPLIDKFMEMLQSSLITHIGNVNLGPGEYSTFIGEAGLNLDRNEKSTRRCGYAYLILRRRQKYTEHTPAAGKTRKERMSENAGVSRENGTRYKLERR